MFKSMFLLFCGLHASLAVVTVMVWLGFEFVECMIVCRSMVMLKPDCNSRFSCIVARVLAA